MGSEATPAAGGVLPTSLCSQGLLPASTWSLCSSGLGFLVWLQVLGRGYFGVDWVSPRTVEVLIPVFVNGAY
jgi:hypothetical protein